MSEHQPTLGVFPGTFDPISYGHLDIIERGRKLFDRVIVAVGENPEKRSLLSGDQRVALIREVLGEALDVEVRTFTGLTVHFAREVGATAILRGIRNSSDLQFESQVALTNRVVAGVETVFMLTSTEHAFTSSSLIKQIATMGGDVSALVPPAALRFLRDAPGGGDDSGIEETE